MPGNTPGAPGERRHGRVGGSTGPRTTIGPADPFHVRRHENRPSPRTAGPAHRGFPCHRGDRHQQFDRPPGAEAFQGTGARFGVHVIAEARPGRARRRPSGDRGRNLHQRVADDKMTCSGGRRSARWMNASVAWATRRTGHHKHRGHDETGRHRVPADATPRSRGQRAHPRTAAVSMSQTDHSSSVLVSAIIRNATAWPSGQNDPHRGLGIFHISIATTRIWD